MFITHYLCQVSYVLLRMFNQQEVQILIGGVDSLVDFSDLRANTNYGGLYDDDSPYIKLFWSVVETFNQEERRALLRFATSCSRPPLLGFKELVPHFCIRDAGQDEMRLPTSSTCVNLLKVCPPHVECDNKLTSSLATNVQESADYERQAVEGHHGWCWI